MVCPLHGSEGDGLGGAGLVHTPLVYSKLPSLLDNKGVANADPTHSNKHCRFSAAQLDKMYRAEGVADFCRL